MFVAGYFVHSSAHQNRGAFHTDPEVSRDYLYVDVRVSLFQRKQETETVFLLTQTPVHIVRKFNP